MAFVVIAAAGITGPTWLLVLGFAAHGLKDAWQQRAQYVSGTRWWPPFCAAVDLVVAPSCDARRWPAAAGRSIHDPGDHDRRVARGRLPWSLQIGYGRGGWYSYDWIDNDGRPSVERIDPALQRLAVGDRIEMLPGLGPVVRKIVLNHHIVSGGETDSCCLRVEPTPDRRTRLISRWRQDWPKSAGTYVWIALTDPGAFLMEQKMLRRIQQLAERDGAVKRAMQEIKLSCGRYQEVRM
jgi:hypothetical protein